VVEPVFRELYPAEQVNVAQVGEQHVAQVGE